MPNHFYQMILQNVNIFDKKNRQKKINILTCLCSYDIEAIHKTLAIRVKATYGG